MKPPGDRYVLATGEEGAFRLGVVHAVHGPDSERLLLRAGLRPGMQVADVGCGTGMVTRWIAERVGPSGAVIAVDVSPEQVELARRETERRELRNVEYRVASACETGLERATFDLVFCRFVLMHLAEPERALAEMLSLVRPGGLLVCEDGDFTRPFCRPPSAAYDRAFELYMKAGDARGVDFRIGGRLYSLVRAAGLRAIEVALVQPCCTRGEAKRLPEWTLIESAPAILAAGLASQEEIDALAAELRLLAADDSALFGMVQVTQVWGRRDVER